MNYISSVSRIQRLFETIFVPLFPQALEGGCEFLLRALPAGDNSSASGVALRARSVPAPSASGCVVSALAIVIRLAGATMTRRLAVLLCAGTLAAGGCSEPVRSVVIRTDGQSIADNPVLRHAYNTDEVICLGEMEKASLSGVTVTNSDLARIVSQVDRQSAAYTVLRGCLAQRGYLIVREDEAEAKRAEFRAVAELASQQQQAAAPSAITTGSIRRK